MAIDAHVHLSSLLDTWLTREDTALTIARRVKIDSYVGDACIIAATPVAGTWYGLKDPGQLIGQWLSVVHHPDDAHLGRVLSAARHDGRAVPTAYVSRIRQGNTHRFRAVMKQTTQLACDGETYWITRLSAPQEPPLALQQPVRQYAHLVDMETAQQFTGRMSVADMEQALRLLETADGISEGGHVLLGSVATAPGHAFGRPSRTVLTRLPTLGRRLRDARQAQGLSQQALAQRCTDLLGQHVSAQHVSRLECGHCLPSLRLLQVLTIALDLDPATVLTARLDTTQATAHTRPVEIPARGPWEHDPQHLLTRVQQVAHYLTEVQQAHHAALVAARQAGASWRQLARAAGLSSSRIRQLVSRTPGTAEPSSPIV